MSSWLGLIRLELLRGLRPRSVAIAVAVLAAYMAFLAPGLEPQYETPANMWDIVMELATIPPTIHLMIAAIAVIAADTILDRERTGVDALIAVRISTIRRSLAKGAAIVLAGVFVGLVAWAVAMAVGAVVYGPTAQLSEWGRTGYDALGTTIELARPYAPAPLPSVPLVGAAVIYLVQGMLMGLYVAAVAAVVQRTGRAWTCPAVAVAGSVAGQLAGFGALNPLPQIIWVSHFPMPDGYLPWITALPLGLLGIVLITFAGPANLTYAQKEAR